MPGFSSFIKLVTLFWNNADQIASLLDALTNKLPTAGAALVNAGNFAVATAQTLKGGGPTPLNAKQSVAVVAGAFGGGSQKIHEMAADVQSVHDEIKNIKVPVWSKSDRSFSVFGLPGLSTDNIPVITLTDKTPFTVAATALGTAQTMLTDLESQFTTAHNNLQGLSNALDQMGTDMSDAGNALISVGQIFQQIH